MRKMYKKNIKKLQKNQGVSGVQGLSFITFLSCGYGGISRSHVEIESGKNSKTLSHLAGLAHLRVFIWTIFISPSEIPAKSSEISPRRANSLST